MPDENPKPVVVVSDAKALQSLLGKTATPAEKHEDRAVKTQHEMTVNGQTLRYTATAGTYRVQLDEKPAVDLFYVAYTLDDAGPERPVTFAFNGGPGSSSVWLHMGILGPKRVRVDVDRAAAIPGVPEDNPLTLLTTSDLVFIDPTSTGHSRPVEGKGKEYHGVKADIESVAALIARWTTHQQRWSSPKYLCGESYGTIRAAGIAHHLQERWGMFFNGLVLISVALKIGTLEFGDDNNWLASVMMLPTAAVTAAYHGKVEVEDVWAHHERAERFARERYMPAMLQGDRLPREERLKLSAEIASLIGVSAAFMDRCDNHLDLARFCAELLRDQRKTIGRLDSRFTGFTRDAQQENLQEDPSFGAVMGVFTSGLQQQLASLGYDSEKAYQIFNPDVWPWTWEAENTALDMTGALRKAMLTNMGLRVFVASGIYDLATPWAAAEYTLAQLQLPPERRTAITSKAYPAGHMMYLHDESAKTLRADIERFYID